MLINILVKLHTFLLFEVEDDGKYEYLGSVKNNPTCSSDEKISQNKLLAL
ncbi:hypothetical protein [Methanobrevibacter arboriphilus]|nr:hypothetical protein [Methanobrevibacter arboriphilus]